MVGDSTNARQPTGTNADNGLMTIYAMVATDAPTVNTNSRKEQPWLHCSIVSRRIYVRSQTVAQIQHRRPRRTGKHRRPRLKCNNNIHRIYETTIATVSTSETTIAAASMEKQGPRHIYTMLLDVARIIYKTTQATPSIKQHRPQRPRHLS